MHMVYWTVWSDGEATALQKDFDNSQLKQALDFCKSLRKRIDLGEPLGFVTMATEDPNMVGKMGVDSIVDGMCPDGVPYTWKKRRI